jgi:hypothetical protein
MSATMGNNELTLALRLEGTTGAASVEVERLVDVAAMVATLPDPEIDPVFAAKLEQRLLTEGLAAQHAETPEPYQGLRVVRPEPTIVPAREEKVAPNVITLPRRRYVMRKALVAAIAAALAMAMPIAMAASALPGSPGYGLNKLRFSAQLHFANAHDKPFLMAHRGHELISFSARLVAINAPSDLVNDTLAEAKAWLAQATQAVISSGKSGDIAKLRSMIERDGDTLRTMLSAANDRNSVFSAIDKMEDLSDALARAMGVVLAEPTVIAPAMKAILADISGPSQRSSSSRTSSENSSGGSTTPAAPQPPTVKDPGVEKPASPGGCSKIGGAQLGNTLDVLSDRLCAGSPDNQQPN